MNVIAVPGRLVRDPVTRRFVHQTPTPIDPTSPFWARILADGDVVPAFEVPTLSAPEAPTMSTPELAADKEHDA